MNAQVISIWGRNSGGKTTFAVNLALALAGSNYLVGIISSKLYYGELQSLFNQRVEEKQGIHAALTANTTKNMFVSSGIKNNLFLLSVPNDIDAMLLSSLQAKEVNEMLEDAEMRFDYIIIDGSEELNNPISSIGLVRARRIFTVHKPSVTDCMWQKSMENIIDILNLDGKMTHILNGYDKSCDKAAYMSSAGIRFDYELPFIESADAYSNAGTPVYAGSKAKVYRAVMNQIADKLLIGVMKGD